MNLYEVEFEGICPVGNCLIIKANNLKEAKMIASKTIAHTGKSIAVSGGNLVQIFNIITENEYRTKNK